MEINNKSFLMYGNASSDEVDDKIKKWLSTIKGEIEIKHFNQNTSQDGRTLRIFIFYKVVKKKS